MAKLLIVEDEGVVAWHIQEALEKLGHIVVASIASGQKAIEIAAKNRPDLVFMDIRLKGEIDGIEAAQEIRNSFNIPVIYLTAYADDQTLERALATNPLGYLIKPFQEKELRTTLEVALQRHKLEMYLENQKEWFFTTLNSIDNATITTDCHGYINFINPAAVALIGCSEQELLGENTTEIFSFIDLKTDEEIENPLIRSIREDLILSLPNHFLLRTKYGKDKLIGETISPLKNSKGKIIGSVLVFKGITEPQQETSEVQQNNLEIELNQKSLLVQLQERTAQLQQVLACSKILKRVIEQVDNNSSQTEIFQSIIQELGSILEADYCWIAQYDLYKTTAIVNCEYLSKKSNINTLLNSQINLPSFPDFYQHLFKREYWQSPPLELLPTPYQSLLTPQQKMLICPIYDEQRVIGEVGILTTPTFLIAPPQTELISQVISHCAITLRQINLDKITQKYLGELELLNNLKDDFISSVSHELRAPLTNMKMAIEMLQHIVHSLKSTDLQTDGLQNRQLIWQKLEQYIQILQAEWRQEFNLISDLLNFQSEGIIYESLISIDLQQYLPEIVNRFMNQAIKQRQFLSCQVSTVIPCITTHLPSLERIVSELLTNACKYSPPDSTITLTAQVLANNLEIQVINTGVELPPQELERIFQPFYRYSRPNSWDYRGTGLGLALVKKLVQCLGGQIAAQSENRETKFVITLPL
jgi:PAS domain S-box-containing protein